MKVLRFFQFELRHFLFSITAKLNQKYLDSKKNTKRLFSFNFGVSEKVKFSKRKKKRSTDVKQGSTVAKHLKIPKLIVMVHHNVMPYHRNF